METWLGLEAPVGAVVLGARGGVGNAFLNALGKSKSISYVIATSRSTEWCQVSPQETKVRRRVVDMTQEVSLARLAEELFAERVAPRFIINCTGLLHAGDLQPERSWREVQPEYMRQAFEVNALGPALAIKHLVEVLPRKKSALFATLSARVGSIGDNHLGGWYSYRASKAAQNMIVKTAALEAKTRRPQLILVSLHPGTVATALSAPFTKRLQPKHVVFTAEESCSHLCAVMSGLTTADSGNFFAWDGASIPW
jgi:NAD(P)-dependent dehydrogenase (short-subunit alcohol dehydrogenase family)